LLAVLHLQIGKVKQGKARVFFTKKFAVFYRPIFSKYWANLHEMPKKTLPKYTKNDAIFDQYEFSLLRFSFLTFPKIWHLISMRHVRILFVLLFCVVAMAARAAHTQATLVLSDDTAKTGDIVWAGVDLKMETGWHTYWKNSGDAGIPTTISWQLAPGITAGAIQWPLPEKLPPIEVTTYGYNNETMLLVPLTIGTNVSPGPITLSANLSWLECKEVCIPVKTSVQATLNISSETKQSADVNAIASWHNKVPQTADFMYVNAWWEKQTNDDTRSVVIGASWPSLDSIPVETADFFPDAGDNYEILPATEVISASDGEVRLRKLVKKYSGDWPKEISGVLVVSGDNQRSGFNVHFPIANEAPSGASALAQPPAEANAVASTISSSSTENTETSSAQSLPLMLLYAFLGGLILNVMPCVLPVIALKILGFVSEARSEPRRVRNLGFIYALGVLVSFAVIAFISIGVKEAGRHVAWGMQWGSPIFVIALSILLVLVTLNLFGVYEVTLGGKLMDAAGTLAARHGAWGAFFNGLLATTLAASCTAAYLVTALGFAFAQSSAIIFLIFMFIGLGLAAPYVLLSCNPGLLKFLPRPGAWMDKFKIAMGFPMLVTVVWLINVAQSSYGSRVFWLGIFLVIIALAAWVFGEFVQRGRQTKGIALAFILVLLIADYTLVLERGLHWRVMTADSDSSSSLIDTSLNGTAWQDWSPQAVAQARAAGKPVLVDFTAAWCVTCNAIVKPALENPSIIARLKALDATALLGDYTHTPQQMTDEIAKYGGAGVPLVLVYPKNPAAPAIVLPQPNPLELPSSYSRKVLTALERAGE
jgi:thiol:disulfide interchange protein/DsbC/DsbD-like thiol-disulfide interchange protein